MYCECSKTALQGNITQYLQDLGYNVTFTVSSLIQATPPPTTTTTTTPAVCSTHFHFISFQRISFTLWTQVLVLFLILMEHFE